MTKIKPFQPESLDHPFFKQHEDFSGFGVLRPRTDELGMFTGTYSLNILDGDAPRTALTISQSTVDMFNLPVGTAFMYTISLNTNKPWNDRYGASYTVLSEGVTVEDPIKLRKLKKEGKVVIYPIFGLHDNDDRKFQKALADYDEGLTNVMSSATAGDVPTEDDNNPF